MLKITHSTLSGAIKKAAFDLYNYGHEIKTETWQATKNPPEMIEVLNHSFCALIPGPKSLLVDECKPDLPWADEHFAERVSGIAHNPPPSHVRWPYRGRNDNGEHLFDGKFSHTYPERMWSHSLPLHNGGPRGIRYAFGDLSHVVKLLYRQPNTRQAFLPIWFPEDTGARQEQRVPCTIGYHFIMRADHLHCVYPIRSCDFIRHFRNDVYMAGLLVQWILNELQSEELIEHMNTHAFDWSKVMPGTLKMDITSLHCFANEKEMLRKHFK